MYYVYLHRDPKTKEVIYIGKGSRGRAWHCAESNSRGSEHASYLDLLLEEGYTPDQWVEIISSGLTNKDAYQLETLLLDQLVEYPRYNKKRDHACVLSSEDRDRIRKLREFNLSYDKIAKDIGTSTMTVFRFLNGHTKSYEF